MKVTSSDTYHYVPPFQEETTDEVELASLLTVLVGTAIFHGGDSGGPYYIDDEGLQEAAVVLCNHINQRRAHNDQGTTESL